MPHVVYSLSAAVISRFNNLQLRLWGGYDLCSSVRVPAHNKNGIGPVLGNLDLLLSFPWRMCLPTILWYTWPHLRSSPDVSCVQQTAGISKPSDCQTHGLHAGCLSRNDDGNHENDENDPDSYKQGVECWTTVLFEIITFLMRKPLNHVTVIAKKSWECLRGIISCNCSLQEKQGKCNCNAN